MTFFSFLPFMGLFVVLMLVCPLTSAAPSTSATAPDGDERIRVDFKDSPSFVHQGGTFRTLTINVDSSATYPDSVLMYLRVENVNCLENANSDREVFPCLSVNFSPETRLSRLFVFITNVSSPSAVAINVGGHLSEAHVSFKGIVGCKRVNTASCVSFSVDTEGVFNNSLFDAGGVDPTDYPLNGPDGSRNASDLITYNLRGFVVNSRFDHEFLRFPIASTDEAKIAAPLRISGTLGTDYKVVGSTFTFNQLSCITLDLRGSLNVGSSIVITGSHSTIRDDFVVLRLRMTGSMLTLSNNGYNYIDIGHAKDRSYFFASTIAISHSSISDIPGASGFRFVFDGYLNLGSKLVISHLQSGAFDAILVLLFPAISGASTVSVSGCAMSGIVLSPGFSEDCTTSSSCIVSVEGNTAKYFYLRDAHLSEGAYVSIANNGVAEVREDEWRVPGYCSMQNFTGPGVVSFLNNDLTLMAEFDGFSGTFEAWNASNTAFGFDGTLSFNSKPMPKRVTLSAIANRINIKEFEDNKSRAEALASLYFGCASVYLGRRLLTPTVACNNATVMRRCDEGLTVYSKTSRGFREEYTMRKAVETCHSQQRDVPPFDESIVIDFAKTPNVLLAHANYYSLTVTLINSEENATYMDLHSTQNKAKGGFTLDLQSITCVQRPNGNESTSNETLPDAMRPCVTIIVPAEGSEEIDNASSLSPSLRGLSIRASEISVSGPSAAIEMRVRGSLLDSEVYITGVRNCDRTSGRPCVAFEVSETASFVGSSFSLADTVITAEITDTTATAIGDDEVTSLLEYNLTGDVSNTVFSHRNLSFATPTSQVAPVRITGFIGSAVNSTRWLFSNLASVSLNLTGSLRESSSFTVKNCSSTIDRDRVVFNINVTDGSVAFNDIQYNIIHVGAVPNDARTFGLPRVVFSKTSITFHESDATFIPNSTSLEDANHGVFFYADLVSGSRLVASNWRRKSIYRGLLSFSFAGEVSGRASVMVTNCEANRISLYPKAIPTPTPDNNENAVAAALLVSPLPENELEKDPISLEIENITCTTSAAKGINGLASPCVRIVVTNETGFQHLSIGVKNIVSPRALQIDVNGLLLDANIFISGINNCMRSNGECIQLNLGAKGKFWRSAFTVADSLLGTYGLENSFASRFVDYNLSGDVGHAVFSHRNIVLDTSDETRTGPVKISGFIGADAFAAQWIFHDLRSVSFDLTGSFISASEFSIFNSSSNVLNDDVRLNVNFSNSVLKFKNLKYNYIYLGDSSTSSIAVLKNSTITFEDMECASINHVLANANKGVSLFMELLGGTNVIVSRFSDSGLDSLSINVRGKVGGKSSISVHNSSLDTVSFSPQFADDCTPALPCQITIDSNAVRTFDLGAGTTTDGSLVVFSNNRPHQRTASGITRVGEDFAGSGIISYLNNDHRIEMKFKKFDGSLEIWGSSYERPHNNTLSFLSTNITPSRISLSSIEHPIIIDGAALDDEKTRLAAFTALRFGCATVVHDTKDGEYQRLVPPSVACTEKAVMRRCEEGLSSYKLPDAAHNHRMEYVNRSKVEACTTEQQVVPDADGDDEDDESSKRKKTVLAVTLVMVGVVCVLGVVIFVIVRRLRRAPVDAFRYEIFQEGDFQVMVRI